MTFNICSASVFMLGNSSDTLFACADILLNIVSLCLLCFNLSPASVQSGVVLVYSTLLLVLFVPHMLWFDPSSVYLLFVSIKLLFGSTM